ncbi:fatty acid desaturase family protein [Roseateles sp.]|uniref:fatty acid desaturase family protein n=1 Tax=Roseateles sp. TaxID=1971397 RepID=UPI00395ACED2
MPPSTAADSTPPEALPPDALSTRRVLSRRDLSPAVQGLTQLSNARFLADVAMNWGLIIGMAALAIWTGHWPAYVLAIVVIATRQHALGILMHDGTHYRCLTSRSLNDAVSDILCALPVGMLTSRYRYEHLQHHRGLNTDDDPYWVDFKLDDTWHWPKPPAAAAWVFARDLLGLNSQRWGRVQWRWSPWVNHFKRTDPKGPPPTTKAERLRIYGFHLAVLGALVATGAWLNFALLWLLPLMTLTPAMVRLRTIAEHLLIANTDELDASRHTVGTWLERWSIAPHNINIHLGHHLYPAVPYYRLPELHAELMKDPRYASRIVTSPGYLGFGKDWMLGLMIQRQPRA